MRIDKFCSHLEAFAGSLSSERDKRSALAFRAIIDGLQPFGKKDTDELIAAQPNEDLGGSDELTLADLSEPLLPLRDFIVQVAAPQPKRAFGRFLLPLLAEHPRMTIRGFVDSVHRALLPGAPTPTGDETLLDAYVAALRNAQHDDAEFPIAYGALIADPRLSKDSIVEIASRFAFQMAKSTSKKAALERIWKMHDASQSFADKAKAMKGRSAS